MHDGKGIGTRLTHMYQSSRLAKLFETRSADLPDKGPILIIRATDNPAYRLFDTAMVHCVQTFKPHADALEQTNLPSHQALPETAKMAIVELTRSKPETLANIAMAFAILDVGAELIIDGAKTDGIDSILKAVKNRASVAGTYAKAHGKTIWLTKESSNNPFDDWITLADITKNKDGYWTAAGIFSSDAIDPASALLIESITHTLSGKGADLGGGWGYLSQKALQVYPDITRLDIFEAEQISLECAQKNIIDDRAHFHWADVQSMSAKSQYDFILMNPPFHASRKADPAIGRDFIATAAKLLAPKGRLWMAANKQLAYETTLDAHFNTWSYEHQTSQYKVIHARRPK